MQMDLALVVVGQTEGLWLAGRGHRAAAVAKKDSFRDVPQCRFVLDDQDGLAGVGTRW